MSCHRSVSSVHKRAKSLEEIAEITKISIRFLRAIESERFSELPGGIFATSYLRQYAAAAEVDVDRLLEKYQASQPSAVDPSKGAGSEVRSLLDRLLGLPA